ncbi:MULTISPECIES: hypothetical protein [Agrobacterium]|uniref:hypothetical protein n=1 Tax=Agrobacterium TaxID=357 RepID=UPI0009BAB0E2|nr:MULTISPECIES: hypothetical protein [Agrobacterium]CUX72319.1 conserved hypothetical protein [Agrobacterium sp. NCPPB 925]
MAPRDLKLTEFAVAPRKPKPPVAEQQVQDTPTAAETTNTPVNDTAPAERVEEIVAEPKAAAGLITSDENVQRQRATTRALNNETSRLRLKELKQNKARESKHFVNVPLDYDTKQRLSRASIDNDVKMTVILKAAIDQFLKDNGY